MKTVAQLKSEIASTEIEIAKLSGQVERNQADEAALVQEITAAGFNPSTVEEDTASVLKDAQEVVEGVIKALKGITAEVS